MQHAAVSLSIPNQLLEGQGGFEAVEDVKRAGHLHCSAQVLALGARCAHNDHKADVKSHHHI